MNNLTNEERETHLNMVADDRSVWHVFSDDPVMIRRLDKISTATKITSTGKHYVLDKGNISIRKKQAKRVLTDAQRVKLGERLAISLKRSTDKVSEAQN